MTFLLRSTVSLLCLAFLISEPVIAVDSDDEAEDGSALSATRAKRPRVTPNETLTTNTTPLKRERERIVRLAEEEHQRVQKKIAEVEARIKAIEEDNKALEALLAAETDDSRASLSKSLKLLVNINKDDSGLRTACLQRLLTIEDENIREKIASAAASLAPMSVTENRILVLDALLGAPIEHLDAIIACVKSHYVYPPLAVEIAPFIQAFPKTYTPTNPLDQGYAERLYAASEASETCRILGLTMAEKTQLIQAIFSRYFDTRAAVPILDLTKELFPIKYNARYISNPKQPGGHEEKYTWTEFCQKNLVLTTTGYEWKK